MTIREKCALAQKASPALAQADAKTRNGAILKMAQYLRESADELLAANETDMRSAGVNGVPEAMLDRLRADRRRASRGSPQGAGGRRGAACRPGRPRAEVGGGPNGLEIEARHVCRWASSRIILRGASRT